MIQPGPLSAAAIQVDHVPPVVDLDAEIARRADLVGAKAAALARARAAGIPVLPGFVVTTAGTQESRAVSRAHDAVLHDSWRALSDAGRLPLVVRSSSTVEDGDSQSMAGLFTSVLDVRGWERFLCAVDDVVRSGGDAPIAVLVQPFLEPAWGGVLFGADPVTGRADRLVVAAVPGGPDRLVSGQVDGAHMTLTLRGRLREVSADAPHPLRARRTRRKLANLARRASSTFGAAQDIEWAVEADGRLVMLQSRPITAVGDEARANGPVLGPGPVAETFGLPLRTLEEDLWVTALRDGLREALRFAGTTPARRLRESPIVVSVGGRVAADLDLLGLSTRRRGPWSRLDPRPPARRLKAAWRVGRLKVALPALANDLVAEVDADLRSIPPLSTLDATDLVRLLRRSHQTLTALHGHEVLAGLLLDGADDGGPSTAASAALRIVSAARDDERRPLPSDEEDEELVARHPVLLSLVPPSIGDGITLPPPPAVSPPVAPTPADGEAAVRESLRLRVRWVQELTARAAMVLGRRLVERGVLPTATAVTRLRLDELAELVQSGGSLLLDLRDAVEAGPPLPVSFRLTDGGVVVPAVPARGDGGRGAGGGRGIGPAHVGTETAPAPGDVLVVRTLDPGLAPMLPGLGGLVAETGSVLSHLAILAREYGVPTVVGLAGAADLLVDGVWTIVDGNTGEVSALEAGEWGAA